MDRRVKFDTQEIKRQKVQSVPRKTREQTSRRELERKNIVERDNSQGKKKQVMGFEDFMKKKPSKAASKTPAEKAAQNRAVVYRGRVNSEINHKNEPPKSKVSNLKKRDVPVDYNDLPEVDQPEKKEMSLENIFNSRQVDEEQHHQEFRPVARNASEIIHEYRPDKLPSVANRSQLDNVTEPPHVGKSVDRGVNYQQAAEEAREYLTLAGDDNSPLSRNIRGTFKKEIYGNDPNNKKESQLRMKKELEKQMEENRLKKEEAKRLKEDEERIEHEKYQKYLEMEKRKKDEEELKEQEAKKKKEIFSMQQAALLEEYKQTVTAEKKIKHGKKTGLTDQGSVHFENIQAAGQASKPIQQSHIYQHNEKPTINLNSNTNNTGYAQYASQTNPTVVTIDPDINTGSNFATGS